MVNIGPQFGNIDPLGDRRRLEKAGSTNKSQQSSQAQSTAAEQGDSLNARSSVSKEDVERYVDILKNMDPTDLHRVENLRQSIEDGTYNSELDELMSPLLDFLSDPDNNTPA